jgi:hypothetical protein
VPPRPSPLQFLLDSFLPGLSILVPFLIVWLWYAVSSMIAVFVVLVFSYLGGLHRNDLASY